MKPQEKLYLIEELSEILASMKLDKVEFILSQYGYNSYQYKNSFKSSRELAYETLKEFLEADLFRIATDYDIELNTVASLPSGNLWKPNMVRVFLSHSTSDKQSATKLKLTLLNWGIELFVAHEDIGVSEEWRIQIIKALSSMDAFAALLTTNFKESNWTDQEFGYALAKNTVIIPLIYGINPYGFMEAKQGIKIKGLTPDSVAASICSLLLKKSKTREKMIESLFEITFKSGGEQEFKENLNKLTVLKDEIGIESISKLRDQILERSYFNHPFIVKTFNSFIKTNFNSQLEFISKKLFLERHSSSLDDDSLPF